MENDPHYNTGVTLISIIKSLTWICRPERSSGGGKGEERSKEKHFSFTPASWSVETASSQHQSRGKKKKIAHVSRNASIKGTMILAAWYQLQYKMQETQNSPRFQVVSISLYLIAVICLSLNWKLTYTHTHRCQKKTAHECLLEAYSYLPNPGSNQDALQ